jgi:organic hydroperoxide reductase OsmC/OhrA
MKPKPHEYEALLTWTGAAAGPAIDYKTYLREYRVEIAGKPPLTGSSDPMFRGDPAFWNPEDMLLASLSACHMLTYLAEAVRANLRVLSYRDRARGTMLFEGWTGQFTEVVLRPEVVVGAGADPALAQRLHDDAHRHCFIARSVNFPVRHEATTTFA